MIDKVLSAQTDFSGGQINEGAKRVVDKQVATGGLAMSNFRQEAQGTLTARPGRGALYISGNRTETFRMSGAVTVQASFVAGGVNITDLSGNLLASYSGSMAPWSATNVSGISISQAVNDLIVCFDENQPLICRWTPSTNSWAFLPFTFSSIAGISQEPFFRLNVPGATMSWSTTTSAYKTVGDSMTITCSEPYFTSAMIGALLSILGGQVEITAVGGGVQPVTTATVAVLSVLPDSAALTPASLEPFVAGQVVSTTTSDYEFEIFSITGGALNGPLMNNVLFTTPTFSGNDGISSELGSTTYTAGGLILFSGTTGTVQWSEEFMSAISGWPSSCFYDKSRLGFCDFPQRPEAVLWGSVGLNQVFYIDASAAGTNQSAGASATAAILEFIDNEPRVRNVVGWSGDQFAFTDSGIYQIPIGTNNPLKPGSVAFLKFSDDGVGPVRPVSTLDTIVYINAGLTRVSVVRATGSLTRPYISDDLSALHSDLMVDPIALAIQTGDGPDPERYIYVVLTGGTAIQGRFTPQKQIVGWVPVTSAGLIQWVNVFLGTLWFNVLYPSASLVEVENVSWNADASIFLNAVPPNVAVSGKGPVWWLAGRTVTLTDGSLDRGDRTVDANGNIIPVQGEDLTSPTLQAGAPIVSTFSPIIPSPEGGESKHQRLRRRKVTRGMVRVYTNAEFSFGGKNWSPYQFGDDATQPAPLREMTYLHRQLGRSFDPQVPFVKQRPGFLRLMECAIEATS